jgi:multiple sugar transport system substrate-binding protein
MTYPTQSRPKRPWLMTAIAVAMLAGTAHADDIRFWTTEEQPERLAKQQAMAEQFKAASDPCH